MISMVVIVELIDFQRTHECLKIILVLGQGLGLGLLLLLAESISTVEALLGKH